ncbi:LPS export ABC transporter permease LptF [Legionella nagasakiensis]|uniref:LPS export ABC transporter permease LptF n=1 Tax=Legionella nagasakiensis TaxID=535290 RepID=UPI001055B195|nr:LPS export ABC transporter permease LptF [Legionella nagasakiensis]
MLIFRYLAKEVFITLASLTTILLLIFMSNQFMRYLSRAASGQIPAMFIMKLMMLELPNLMGLLLPLGFYVAILIAYGRLYAESEMTVLQACGYGPQQLLKHSMIMASVVTLIVLVIMVWASPVIAVERAKVLRTSGVQTLIQTIVPGRFREIQHGERVFYVEKMNASHTVAQNVFMAQLTEKEGKQQWDILWADKAFAEMDEKTSEDYIIFQDGKAYQGVPGQADYQVAEFERYQARLPHPVVAIKEDVRTAKTASLWPWKNPDLRKAAELQWRLSVPIMVLTLTLVAVPLSRVNPRAGKYAKLLPAIVLYIIYANFMFIARDWLMAGKIPIWLGMWWLHLTVALMGGLLIWRNRVKFS